MVALLAGKGLALATGKPLVAVNHLEGHALSPGSSIRISTFPIALLVSGGHCQLLEVEGVGEYRRPATTIDDAAGEAFDRPRSCWASVTRAGRPSRSWQTRAIQKRCRSRVRWSARASPISPSLALRARSNGLPTSGEYRREDIAA